MADCVLPATTSEAGGTSGKAESPVNSGWSRKHLPIDTRTSAFPAQGPWPNPYEDSLCQETHSPSERFWLFFRLPGTRRSRSSVACPAVIAVPRCTPMWLHQTLLEALAPVRAHAEKALHGPLRPRNNIVPSARPLQKHGCTVPCASERQVRRRGSPQQPLATIVVYARARAGVQSRARAPGYTA